MLTLLEIFGVDNNLLTGQLPTELGLLTGLRQLYLASNDFEGSIPIGLCRLQDDFYLHLFYIEICRNKVMVLTCPEEGCCPACR